jgi:anti-sigma B factor antagonist
LNGQLPGASRRAGIEREKSRCTNPPRLLLIKSRGSRNKGISNYQKKILNDLDFFSYLYYILYQQVIISNYKEITMNIKVANEEHRTTVYLSGSVDIPGAESLKKVLNQIADDNPREVCIDFDEVNFIGSSGIGKLLLFYKKFTSRGGRVSIVNLNKEITALFKAIKLDKLFNI